LRERSADKYNLIYGGAENEVVSFWIAARATMKINDARLCVFIEKEGDFLKHASSRVSSLQVLIL
jgi:hypothetical protein